jgi:prepilin-type N-terminal cleavage/methylation domain-containing protein
MKRTKRRGFTLVELLVVIAIIGVMVAAMIPAIQSSRELGRRAVCRSNLSQIMLALDNYQHAFHSLPPGVLNPDGPIRSEPKGRHQGWLIPLLPYLDEVNIYRAIDLPAGVYDSANVEARNLWPSQFICPSEPNEVRGASNYAGCHHDVEAPIAQDNHGVLFLNSAITRDDIPDGASHTMFVGEKRADIGDLGWMSGTRATLRNTGLGPNDPSSMSPAAGSAPTYVGGFAGPHPSGLLVGFGDASVRFVQESIDTTLWQRLGHRADGKVVDITWSED